MDRNLRLEGQGEPYYSSGPRDMRILTIVIAPKEAQPQEEPLRATRLPEHGPPFWFLISSILVVVAAYIQVQ